MSCLPGFKPPTPQLPTAFGLTPPIDANLAVPDPGLCCKLPPIPIPPIPIHIPALILNPGVIATLNAFIETAVSYLHVLPIECPLE